VVADPPKKNFTAERGGIEVGPMGRFLYETNLSGAHVEGFI